MSKGRISDQIYPGLTYDYHDDSYFFQTTTEPEDVYFIRKKILDTGRNKESFYMKPLDGFQKVKDGHFAYFCEEATAIRAIRESFESHEICTLKTVPFHRNELIGFIIKKYSPLRKRLFLNLLWMQEVGIIYKVSQHWNGVRPTCTSRGHFEDVRMEYLAPIFLFLIVAHILSLTLLFCELFVKYLQKMTIENVKVN